MAFNNPIFIKWNENSQVIPNEQVIVTTDGIGTLSQIPDSFAKVQIDNMYEIKQEEEITDESYFKVNYRNGTIAFHPNKIGKLININKYNGLGVIYYPASRIYDDTTGGYIDTTKSLQDFINQIKVIGWQGEYDNNSLYLPNAIIYYPQEKTIYRCVTLSKGNVPTNTTYWQKLISVKEASDYATAQGDYAKSKGDYAKTEGDYAKQQGDLTNQAITDANNATNTFNNETMMIYKPYVTNYADIATTYSSPQNGWTTVVTSTNTRYRYNSTLGQWVNIDIAPYDKIGNLLGLNTQNKTDLVGAINENVSQLNDIAINIKYSPAPLVRAVGDGVTNDSSAINAILKFAGQNNKSVYIPDGTFFATGLTSGGCKYIFGNGENSIIKATGQGNILTLDTDKTTVFNITFLGQQPISQNAISISYAFNCNVLDCTFRNLGTNGIYLTQIGLGDRGSRDGATISRCHFYNCYRGITCDNNAEYVTITDCNFQEFCGWAIWTVAGNTIIDGCNIVKCANGIYIGTVTNGAHGTITGTNINHIINYPDYNIGYALWIEGITQGETITGVAIFEANIMIKNSKSINFANCELAVHQYIFDNAECCDIHDCILSNSYANATPIINNYNSHDSFVNWYNNKDIGGTYKSGIENIKGGQVVGTTVGQTIPNGNTNVINFSASVNTANHPNSVMYSDWWTSSTNKAKNKGFGGNKLQVNIQIFVTFDSGGDTSSTQALLHIGNKFYIMTPCRYGTTSCYYTFNSFVIADIGDEIYVDFTNNSGVTATVSTSSSRLFIEGL